MDRDPYQPIACSAYDIYEIAIMRNQYLDLCWRQGGEEISCRVKPLALNVRAGAEYLVFNMDSMSGDKQEVRLDRIISSHIVEP